MLNKLLLLSLALLLQGRGAPPAPPLPPLELPGGIFIGPGNVALPAGANQAAAQQLPPGTATVDGIVTVLGTSDPIPGAVVEMRRAECGRNGESKVTTSGADGRFTFREVRAGNWCIGAARSGGAFSPVEYGQRGFKGRGMTVPVADNQQVQGITLMMPPTGSISGRVFDSDNEPMQRVRVQAMEAFYQNGQRRLYALNVVQTNDMGEFSLFWLPPGEYYVSAVPEDPLRQNVMFSVSPPGMGGHRSDALPPVVIRRNSSNGASIEEVYAPIYYGGGVDPQRAQKIVVAPGSSNVIELHFAGARTRSFHIRGRVLNGVNGQPAEGAQLRLYPREWTATAVVPYARADKEGNFDIAGVAPGAYALYVSSSMRDPNAPIPAAIQGLPAEQLQQLIAQGVNIGGALPIGVLRTLDVGNQDVDNLSLPLLPGGTLMGEVIFEGNLANLTPQQRAAFRIALMRQPDIPGATLGGASTAPLTDSTFRIQNIFPGTFSVMIAPLMNPFAWVPPVPPEPLADTYVKSIRYGSVDALSSGLRLETHSPDQRLQVILAVGGKVEGVATNDRNEPLPNVKVALVPDFAFRSREDLYRNAVTDASGRFRIQGIAPGDYKIFAWEDIADGAWQDSEILRDAEPRGKPVRLREGEQTVVEVVAIPGGRR
jgi:protocatechuate 3,4-dioxygenase beta subunit